MFNSPIRFIQVRKPTDFGFVLDDMGNMPAMEVDSGRIRGTEATVEVRYVFGELKKSGLVVCHVFLMSDSGATPKTCL